MKEGKVTLKEAYRMLFEMEEKIEFMQYFINKQLEDEENLTQFDIIKIEQNIQDLECLTKKRNILYKKLESFDSIYIEL